MHLTKKQRKLLGIIKYFHKNKGCFCGNDYLCNELDIGDIELEGMISKLEDLNLIEVDHRNGKRFLIPKHQQPEDNPEEYAKPRKDPDGLNIFDSCFVKDDMTESEYWVSRKAIWDIAGIQMNNLTKLRMND